MTDAPRAPEPVAAARRGQRVGPSATAVIGDRAGERVDEPDAFETMVRRLNKLSVEIHHDAYADIPWDDPQWQLAADDRRLVLGEADPFGAVAWYRALEPERQAEVGLYRVAACMKTGWHFENFLQRGLLSRAMVEPDGSVAFRYLHHEVVEESQHTLMFQEFAVRSGQPVKGMPLPWRLAAEATLWMIVRVSPALFFVLVLGGEEPADHLQRSMLREGVAHPLVERIIRIHVTEEARHISFARHFLKRVVPTYGPVRRAVLAVQAPLLLGAMARMMLQPPADLLRRFDVPSQVVREAFGSEQGREFLAASVAKTRTLLGEIGAIPGWAQPLWRLAGIADPKD